VTALAHPTTIRMAALLKRGAATRGYADLADLADHYSDAAITAHGPDAFALAVSPEPALLAAGGASAAARAPVDDLRASVARRLAILRGHRSRATRERTAA
jgi:hypothetical protein